MQTTQQLQERGRAMMAMGEPVYFVSPLQVALFTRAQIPHVVIRVNSRAGRPDWANVYDGCVHAPDGDQDLIAVSRETLRLAKSAIERSQREEAYHNYSAAWREVDEALKGWPTTSD